MAATLLKSNCLCMCECSWKTIK